MMSKGVLWISSGVGERMGQVCDLQVILGEAM